MIRTPAIITFANQKGGVGKTTLCVSFANFLFTMGVRVVVIDCDIQHSIFKSRTADIGKYGEELIPYQVAAFDANNMDGMNKLLRQLRNDPSIDVVLMDAPGNLTAAGLVPLFANSDIIVVPFHYDLVTVPSTARFLMFIEELRKAMNGEMKSKLFIVPNQNDQRVGKHSEMKLWEKTRETFSAHGQVTAKIPLRADMQRCSTMVALDMQIGIVERIYKQIYAEIFDTDKAIRTVELTGLQLTSNFIKAMRSQKVKETQNEETQEASENETAQTQNQQQ